MSLRYLSTARVSMTRATPQKKTLMPIKKANQIYIGAAQSADDLDKLVSTFRGQPQVALVARSNAGKSSLINAIIREKVAIVSKMPGRTRLAHAYQAKGFILIDLPGYGYAKGGGEGEAEKMSNIVAECALERESTDLVLQLIDARRGGFMETDMLMREALEDAGTPVQTVFTKMDCIKKVSESALLRERFPEAWFVSSSKNVGISDLRAYLSSLYEDREPKIK